MDWNNPLIYIVPGLAVLGWIIRLERWMGKKDESIRFLEKAINELKSDNKEMKSDIKELFRNNSGITPVVEQNSPLRLTEAGQSISEALDVRAWATRTAQGVIPKLNRSHPYDIQVFCMDYVDHTSNFDNEFMNRLKSYAYEEAFSMSQIKDVLAIELRDAILNTLPDLKNDRGKPDGASASHRVV